MSEKKTHSGPKKPGSTPKGPNPSTNQPVLSSKETDGPVSEPGLQLKETVVPAEEPGLQLKVTDVPEGTEEFQPDMPVTEENHPRRRKGDQGGLRSRFASAKEYKAQGMAAFLVLASVIIFYYALHSLPMVATFLKKIIRAVISAIWGFCIAFLLNPVVKFFEKMFIRMSVKRAKKEKSESRLSKAGEKVRKLRRRKAAEPLTEEQQEARVRGRARSLAIFVTVVLAIAMVTLLLVAIIPEFTSSIGTLLENLPTYGKYLKETLEKAVSKNKAIAKVFAPYIDTITDGLNDFLSQNLTGIIDSVRKVGTNVLTSVIRFVFNLLIGIIFSIYLMKDKEYLMGVCKKVLFAIFPKKTAKVAVQTIHKANGIFTTAILGKILDSAIIGMLCFIGTSILGIFFDGIAEYKGLVSIIVGVTNVIPFFGPFIGGVPCAVLIFCIRPLHGLIFAAFILVLQQFDGNYLDPHIVGKKVGLRPIYVLFACMLFSNLWGLIGMLVAVPTFALVYSLLKSYLEVRLVNKALPRDTASYMNTPGAVLARRSDEEILRQNAAADASSDQSAEQPAPEIKNC